jgi:hypothetical protein
VDTESPAAAEPGTTPPLPAARPGPAPAGAAMVNGRIGLSGLRRGSK